MAFIYNENGQSMVEYALIIGLIAIVAVAALAIIGPRIADIFNESSNALPEN
ncbi:MAG: Flp family type IVb pilin [Eubacterium sp.]|nr:Flp family type IVb pilin [Eubacterium sp.]